jgi:hypothetical protein
MAAGTLAGLQEDLAQEFAHYHVRAHAMQFAGLFLSALVTAVATGGLHVIGWGALAGLVVGAGGVALRQMWPQVPWGSVLGALDRATTVAAPSGPLPANDITTPTISAPKT